MMRKALLDEGRVCVVQICESGRRVTKRVSLVQREQIFQKVLKDVSFSSVLYVNVAHGSNIRDFLCILVMVIW